MVTHNEHKYRCTGHRLRLNQIDRTKFTKIDVIGHVVERYVIKEKDVNGKKSKLIDITLEDNEVVQYIRVRQYIH